jgi:hypothetical protein
MSVSKMTPGPWVAVPSSRGGDYIEQAVSYEEGQEVPDPIPCPGSGGAMSYSRTICQMHWSGTEEWRANTRAIAAVPKLVKALEWYGEQARLCRLIHSEGDAGRNALAADGGGIAREALAAATTPEDS